MKYDVFLSHADADKDSFVEELKQSFDKLGVSVFYDKDSIEWGNDWSQKIKEGLDKCDFGVVIVSKDFYDREWTEKELKSLLIRQNENGDNIILPILYNTNLDELKKHCKKSCYKDLAKIQFIRFPEDGDVKDITIRLAKILLNAASHLCSDSEISNSKIFKEFLKDRSYEFDKWLDDLIQNNNEWTNDYDEYSDWWYLLTVDGESIPLIQQKHRDIQDHSMMFGYNGLSVYQYRINPIYFDSFCDYFNENIKPQL